MMINVHACTTGDRFIQNHRFLLANVADLIRTIVRKDTSAKLNFNTSGKTHNTETLFYIRVCDECIERIHAGNTAYTDDTPKKQRD